MPKTSSSYKATPKLERELAREGRASLEGGKYRATVVTSGAGYYEAWTDNLPFVYGRPGSTLQEALDNLDEQVRAHTDQSKAVDSSKA